MSTPRDDHRDQGTDAAAERGPEAPTDAAATGPVRDDELAPTAVLDDVRATEVIDPLPAAQAEGATTPSDRPRRRAKPWIIVVTCVLALVAVLVVADVVTRSVLEQRIVEQIEANLPEGVDGEVTAHVAGFSVLAQLATGSLEQITLDASGLEVDGNPLDAHVVAEGVPVQQGAPIDRVSGTVDLDEASVNALVELPGENGEISIGDGTLGYQTSMEVLGLDLGASITASAEAAGTNVLLTPVGVELSAGENSFELGGLAQQLLGDAQLDVCVAQYLPAGVQVEQITLTEGHAQVAFTASDVPFEEASLRTNGTCDAS
ncbi:LmeA family phospholipid-binding protein [Agromyces sp. Marseille-Q5079]|uniref:LmeA family phospholipid-binding protein n=1 Tax=Agromyces sp. Marseille-Q5079 TaxID=3439059 RepID=UPI003D9C7E34